MGAGIAEDLNNILPLLLGADITHARGNSPGVKSELTGARRTQDVEKFVDFRRAHRSILSFKHYRNDGQPAVRQHTPFECKEDETSLLIDPAVDAESHACCAWLASQ